MVLHHDWLADGAVPPVLYGATRGRWCLMLNEWLQWILLVTLALLAIIDHGKGGEH